MNKWDVFSPCFPVLGETLLQRWKNMGYFNILYKEEQFSTLSNEKICPTKTISRTCLLLYILGIPAGIAVKFLLHDVMDVNQGVIMPGALLTVALFKYIMPKLLLVLVPWVSRRENQKAEKLWSVLHESIFRSVILFVDLTLLHEL